MPGGKLVGSVEPLGVPGTLDGCPLLGVLGIPEGMLLGPVEPLEVTGALGDWPLGVNDDVNW